MPYNPEGVLDTARPTLLLTRPEAQSRRFAGAFRARFGGDWPVILSPLMEIVPVDPGPIAADCGDVVFTSENAVNELARRSRDRSATAWCVGTRTAAAARAAGFTIERGPGDAAGLVAAIRSSGRVGKVLWPRAVHAARDISSELKAAGIETISVIVYDQQSCTPSAEATAALSGRGPVLVPLFSPRSAQLFATAFPDPAAPLFVAAISTAVAEAAAAIPLRRCQIAQRHDAQAMLDALDTLAAAVKMG